MDARTADSYAHRSNNFDFLRHLAAFLVIYGHSQALLHLPYSRLWAIPVSTVGVLIFFSISGYLVTGSWDNDPRPGRFLLKRALRIFPGLAVCVTLTAVALGPVMTEIPLQKYFNNYHFSAYFWNIVLYIRYSLPGVFTQNPYPNAVNGSLWSLPVEFFCYLTVLSAALAGRSNLRTVITGILLIASVFASLYFGNYYKGPQIVFYATDVSSAFSVIPYFFSGALIKVARVPLRLDVSLIAALALFAIEGAGPQYMLPVLLPLAIPYIVLSFGQSATPMLRSFGRFGDMSYGLYLYAFPIQQTLIALFPEHTNLPSLILASTCVSVALAYLSWHSVEKLALRYKPGSAYSAGRAVRTNADLAYSKAAT